MYRVVLFASLTVGLLTGACAAAAPDVPLGPDGEPDPVLAEGREVYGSRCANCHGGSGGGGSGPKLSDGATVESFPTLADLVEIVRVGEGGMPGYGDILTEAQLEAVARYVREVL